MYYTYNRHCVRYVIFYKIRLKYKINKFIQGVLVQKFNKFYKIYEIIFISNRITKQYFSVAICLLYTI